MRKMFLFYFFFNFREEENNSYVTMVEKKHSLKSRELELELKNTHALNDDL